MCKLLIGCVIMAILGAQSDNANSKYTDSGEYEAAVRKLYDAAWKEPPKRIDALIYRELKLRAMTNEEARGLVKHWFDIAEGKGDEKKSVENEEEIELNVRRILEENSVPRRMVQRVRIDEECNRIDQSILPKHKQMGPDVVLSHTYVNRDKHATAEGYKNFEYVGENRAARILPDDMKIGGTPVREEWITPPYMQLVRKMFGNVEGDRIVPDESKLEEFIVNQGFPGGGVRYIQVSKALSRNGSNDACDRLEFVGGVDGDLRTIITMVCDRDDYTRVYSFEVYHPNTGRMMMLKEVDEYDDSGIPVQFRIEKHDEQGGIKNLDVVSILRFDTPAEFSKDVFTFHPPEGYAVVDARQLRGQVIVEGRATTAEAGETVGNLLQTNARDPLARKRRKEIRIELPGSTSKPTSQPTPQP